MADDEEYALAIYQVLRTRGEIARAHVAGAAGLDEEQTRRGLARLRALGLVRDGEAGADEAGAGAVAGGGTVARNGTGTGTVAGAGGGRGAGAGEEGEGGEEGEDERAAGPRLVPVEPDTALLRTMDAYRANAAEQAAAAAALQRHTRSLMSVYGPAVARETARVEVEYISDRRVKDRLLHDLNATVKETCDSLHPGPMPPMEVLDRSLAEDAELVARGVRCRAIYPQSLLQSPKHVRYLDRLAELGVEVRLIAHAAYDLVLLDRRVAFLPTSPGTAPSADLLLIRGSSLINAQIAMFEDYWLRSLLYDGAPARPPDTGLTPQERVVIRLMAGGLNDDQIARRMGVHRRTVQRAVAKLMERLGATSRFEAGLRLAQEPEFARFARPDAKDR